MGKEQNIVFPVEITNKKIEGNQNHKESSSRNQNCHIIYSSHANYDPFCFSYSFKYLKKLT